MHHPCTPCISRGEVSLPSAVLSWLFVAGHLEIERQAYKLSLLHRQSPLHTFRGTMSRDAK